MVCRLPPDHTLHRLLFFLLEENVQHSWVSSVRDLCQMYSLPEPLMLLTSPPTKFHFKSQVKSAICAYWHSRLCNEAKTKSSLKYLRCEFIPLGKSPHPVWTSCKSGSPSNVRAATIVAKVLCGTYRSDYRLSKFSGESPACSLPNCSAPIGDVFHLLSGTCPALRGKLVSSVLRGLHSLMDFPVLHAQVLEILAGTVDEFVSFIVDPSTHPSSIIVRQQYGISYIYPLMQFSCTFIWTMHREHFRLKGLSIFLK